MALAHCQATQRHWVCVFAGECEYELGNAPPSYWTVGYSESPNKINLDNKEKISAKSKPLLPVQSLYVQHNKLIWQENRHRKKGKQNCSQSSDLILEQLKLPFLKIIIGRNCHTHTGKENNAEQMH